MLKKNAFTLAEVLITLGIIGVVAAIMILAIQNNYQKNQTEIQLKKSYSTIAQVFKHSEADNGLFQYWDRGDGTGALTARESFDVYWKPYLKITKVCQSAGDCGYTSNYYKRIAGSNFDLNIYYPSYRTTCVLASGEIIIVSTTYSSFASGDYWIIIDLNGGKQPNKLGRDVFMFTIDNNKGLVPLGYNESVSTVNSDCVKNGFGLYCSTKILKNGWQIDSSYPW